MTANKEFKPIDIEELKTGYVMAWENNGDKFGNLIEKHQLSRGIPPEFAHYVHLDILGRRDSLIQISPPRAHLVKVLDAYPKGRRCIMLRYKATDFEDRRRDVAWWAAALNGRPYDIFGIIKFKLQLMWHGKDKFFCSEGVLWSYRQEYPDILKGRDPYTFMPGEIFTTPEFEEAERFVV